MSASAAEIAMRAYRKRSRTELVRDAHAAAARLSIATRSWGTSPPSRAALADALRTADGLRDVLTAVRAADGNVHE
jgi:hypothetical protein